jgi:hypothetical protein
VDLDDASQEQDKGPMAAVSRSIAEAESSLQNVDPTPFSEGAFRLLIESISEYTSTLTSESSRIARRQRADAISRAHVEQAQQHLVTSRSRPVMQHLGTIGGIFFGAAVGNILSLVSADTIKAPSVLITAGLLVFGAFLVALHIGRDLR